MARPPATPEQRRLARETIRQAAHEIVNEDGPSGVTVRKVAARAGVSVGAVYGHFDSVHDLLRSLWVPVIEEASRKLAATADAYPDPVDRMRAILGEYAGFVMGNPALHRNTLLFVRPAKNDPPDRFAADSLALHRLLVEAVQQGQAAGTVIDGDPTQLAQVLWAGVHGALALPVNADIYDLEPAEKQAELMIETLIRSIATEETR